MESAFVLETVLSLLVLSQNKLALEIEVAFLWMQQLDSRAMIAMRGVE